MSSTIGENIKCSIFGESHGKAIGVVIDGLPAGVSLDTEKLVMTRQQLLVRRLTCQKFFQV